MFNSVLFALRNGVSSLALDVFIIVLFALLSIAAILIAVWLINLSITKKHKKLGSSQLFGIVLVATFLGLALRIMLSLLITGHRTEYYAIAGGDGAVWKILNDGFDGFYLDKESGLIYPFVLYSFSLFATLGSWFGVTATSAITPLLIKLPLIIADLLIAVIIYKAGKKYFSQTVAVILSSLFSLCPIFMFPSSVWGSHYAILALFLLLTFYTLAEKKYLLMFISYSLALLTAKESVFLFPVIAIFVIYRFIKSLQLNRSDRTGGLTFWGDKGLIFRLPLYFITCLIGMYIISLPFIIEDYNANFFVWLNELYIMGLAKVNTYGHNSLSLYNIFNMNGSLFGTDLVPLFVVLFLGIVVALTVMYYLTKKNRANLVMLGAFIYMTMSIFFVDFREMSSYPTLVILLLAFLLVKDKRLLQVLLVYGLVFVLNGTVAMAAGGYLNHLSPDAYRADAYFGIDLLESAVGKTLNIIFCAVAIISYIHFTFIIMDIVMNQTRKPFEGQDRISPLYTMKHWIKK